MREWWANVYSVASNVEMPYRWYLGQPEHSREACERNARIVRRWNTAHGPHLRFHVRLKPEGAPRRYASEVERANWESAPDLMRALVRERQEADRRRQREREERFIFAAG